jgi:hypothetical protein
MKSVKQLFLATLRDEECCLCQDPNFKSVSVHDRHRTKQYHIAAQVLRSRGLGIG